MRIPVDSTPGRFNLRSQPCVLLTKSLYTPTTPIGSDRACSKIFGKSLESVVKKGSGCLRARPGGLRTKRSKAANAELQPDLLLAATKLLEKENQTRLLQSAPYYITRRQPEKASTREGSINQGKVS